MMNSKRTRTGAVRKGKRTPETRCANDEYQTHFCVIRALESKILWDKFCDEFQFNSGRMGRNIIRVMNAMIKEGTLLQLTHFFSEEPESIGMVTKVILNRGLPGESKKDFLQGMPIPALHRFRCEMLIDEACYEVDFHIWFDTSSVGAALSLTYSRVDKWTRLRQPCRILCG